MIIPGSIRKWYGAYVFGAGSLILLATAVFQLVSGNTAVLPVAACVSFPLMLLGFLLIWFTRGESGPVGGGHDEQLIHVGRLCVLGEMTSSIVHEMNQPLCVIRGYLELMQMFLKDEPVYSERRLDDAFRAALDAAGRTGELTRAMRRFAQSQPNTPVPVKAGPEIDRALFFFGEQLRQHNIEICKEYDRNVPEIMIDPQRLDQLTAILITNARDSLDRKGRQVDEKWHKKLYIRIYFDRPLDRVFVEFSDNGMGMDERTRRVCSEPFFTTHQGWEGTGLGISCVSRIVHAAGGYLEIATEEAEGATFRMAFPPAATNFSPDSGYED